MGPDSPQPAPTQTEKQSYSQEITLKSESTTARLHVKGAQILNLTIGKHEILKPRTTLRALAFKDRTGEVDTSGDGGSFLGFPWSRYWLRTSSNILKMIHGPSSIAALTWATTKRDQATITMETGGIKHDSENARQIFGDDLFSLERSISLTDDAANIINTIRYDGQRSPIIENSGQRHSQGIDLKLAEHPYFKASPNACFHRKDGTTTLVSDLLNENGDLKEHINLIDLLGNDDEIWYMPEGKNGHVVKIKIFNARNDTNITNSTRITLWRDPESSGYICIEPVLTMPNVTELNIGDTFIQTITISTADSLKDLQTVA